jgi:hypothetical protein
LNGFDMQRRHARIKAAAVDNEKPGSLAADLFEDTYSGLRSPELAGPGTGAREFRPPCIFHSRIGTLNLQKQSPRGSKRFKDSVEKCLNRFESLGNLVRFMGAERISSAHEFRVSVRVETTRPTMHTISFLKRAALRHGALLVICGVAGLSGLSAQAADRWTDISSPLLERLTNNGAKPAWPGGCSGAVVNRTNGDVTIKVVGLGLWSSSDKGVNWRRIDGDTVSGRDETGWATSADQNAPTRLASFSLDGTAGWTSDGNHWKSFTNLGRNWDFGSVDWGAPVPKTIIAAKHETTPPGEVYLTQDGGVTWTKLSVYLNGNRDRISMVGALDATTLIYANGDSIHRSKDAGVTWTKVSSANPQTRIPVLFRGAHYLGTTNGLLVSKDLGANWQEQGAAVNIWQGPFFGRNEKEMLVIGKQGCFMTRDAGSTWKFVASLKPKEGGFVFTPNWFGCYAWDSVNNILYASSMGNPVYKLEL